MKHSISALAQLPLALGLLATVSAEPVAMRDVATHDQLSEKLRVATNQGPSSNMTPATGADPAKVNKPRDIVSSSDFLSFNGVATLVPKRAILHTPPQYANRIKFQPGSTIQTWADFYAVNRAWVTTVEVTRMQAKGAEPLPEDLVQRIQKSSSVVVATYKTGPISVLPPKVAAPAAPAATTPSVPTSTIKK